MPTIARIHAPGALVHVVARVVNREFLIAGDEERAAYLHRIPIAIARTDWSMLAFGLMSNHVHLALIAGDAPPWKLYQSLHISFATWLNATRGRLGPVFAGRPATIYMPVERTALLVAYIHNNPIRAGVVASPGESSWTSHAFWTGEVAAPVWLDVPRGLIESGFGVGSMGRAQFDDFVRARAGDLRDPRLSGTSERTRAELRSLLALPVEVSSPLLANDSPSVDVAVRPSIQTGLRYCGPIPAWPRWDGDLALLVAAVGARLAVPPEVLRSRSHSASVVYARRVACVAGVVLLRRRTIEVAAALGISGPAASKHLRGAAEPEVFAIALEVAEVVRGVAGAVTIGQLPG